MRRAVTCLLVILLALPMLGREQGDTLRTRDSLFFKTDEARRIGDQLLLFQRVTGGWPKNINMVKPLTDEEAEAVQVSKSRLDDSTIDNHATIMQMAFHTVHFDATGIRHQHLLDSVKVCFSGCKS